MANADTMLGTVGEIRKHSGWFIALGIAFIIGGVFAIAMPVVAGVTVALVVGWALIFVGAVQLVQSWSTRDWGGFIWQLIIGLVVLAGGISVIVNPIVSTVTLTLLLGLIFVAKGIMQAIVGEHLRPNANWSWLVAAGLVSFVLGVLILIQWPSSSVWVLGTLAGVSLVFSGWSYIMVAIAARKMA